MNRFNDETPKGRIVALLLFSLVSIGLISVRLFVLQVVSHDYYLALASAQHERSQELNPVRGRILLNDRFSQEPYLVATNENRPRITADPQQISEEGFTAQKLSEILEIDERVTLDKLKDKDRKYVVIAGAASREKAEEITKAHLPGIFLEDQSYRQYPENFLAAQVLGFMGFSEDRRMGVYGIERSFQEVLAGKPGLLAGARDLRGNWITTGSRDFEPAIDGRDIILTLDRAVQYKVEEVLAKTVQQFGAKRGSVVVLDPKTGAVLAMANFPTFNLNEFNNVEDIDIFNNHSVQTAYEPGSVMKPVTFAAALNEEAITPETEFEDPGFVDLENFTIKNANSKIFGKVNMTQVLNESINTGLVFVEQQVGHEKFREYMENFGFGSTTGIELPLEGGGNIKNLYRGGDLYPATISYGQGMTATPIQIVAAYAAIANGGKLYKPYIVDKITSSIGEEKTNPKLQAEVISQKAATTLGAMMVSVVEQGHGSRAGVPGYFIAGKTGTAQVPYENRAGYDPDRTIGTFAGFGPISDPVFAMVVKIEEPQGVQFAESTAAPAFGEIAKFILQYYQVPTTR